MIELKVINKHDPLKRKVEKQWEREEYSPMDPPDAYAPPHLENTSYEDLHPFLQGLMDDHRACIEALSTFEATLIHIQSDGFDPTVNEKFSQFFEFFDTRIVAHFQKEDKVLFPVLHRKLLENGEHSRSSLPHTTVNILEDDHLKVLQLAAVVFNFLGIAMRLPDPGSRMLVLDAALEQGKVLIELLRLHIFREENIVFCQAHRLIASEEFDVMA